jgi:hypothetical protein
MRVSHAAATSSSDKSIADTPLDLALLVRLVEEVRDQFPVLQSAPVPVHRGGIPTMTPDGQHIVGPVPGAEGFFVASGCNVAGLSIAPAIGEQLCQWILDGSPTEDLRPMSIARFGPEWRDEQRLREAAAWEYRHFYSHQPPSLTLAPVDRTGPAIGLDFSQGSCRPDPDVPEGPARPIVVPQRRWCSFSRFPPLPGSRWVRRGAGHESPSAPQCFDDAGAGRFPNEPSVKHAVNWLYAALMWARYTSQTDQRLEADVSLVVKEANPWDALRAQIVDQRGRIEVQASDFAGRGAQSPFYRATFILAKAHNAVDWFNVLPLADTHGAAYGLHSHHVFPQGILYKSGLDPDDYTHRQLVNEIANRAFLTAETNLTLGDRPADVYLPEVEARFPGALPSQFIPMDPRLWRAQRFRDFLQVRRELIALKLNEFMKSLIAEPEKLHHRPVVELIKLGESYTLELKSTLQWDVVKGERNSALRMSVIKTIAAFFNSDGGTLVIGVDDDGTILGLTHDLALLDGSLDKFERTLVQLVSEHLGLHVAPLFRVRFEAVDSARVCVVDVDRSAEPVFAKTEKGKEFFVRNGNTTRALDAEEAHRYVEMNWS